MASLTNVQGRRIGEEEEEAAAAARPAPVVAKRGSCRSAWEKRASEAAMLAWNQAWYRKESITGTLET